MMWLAALMNVTRLGAYALFSYHITSVTELVGLAGRFAVVHAHADHLEAGDLVPAVPTVQRDESIAAILIGESVAIVERQAQRG